MNLSIIKDLSLLKLSGLSDLIIVDILQDKARIILAKRRELFTKVKNGDIHYSVNITENISCPLDDEFFALRREVKDLIKKNGLKDPLIIAGIGEFRHFQVSVPSDTEDIELWLLENSGKFLPEGRPKDEFTYSYEILRQDESYFYYNVIVVRSDYLKRLQDVLSLGEGRLIAIIPFPVALLSNAFTKDKTAVYIRVSESMLIYSAVSHERLFCFGELYNEFTANGVLNISAFQNEISDLKEIIYPVIKDDLPHAILDINESFFKQAEHILKSVFPNASVNEHFSLTDPSITGSLIGLNHVYNNIDSSLNLLKDDEKVRFSIEKQFTMRIMIFIGIILISFLLLFFISENYLSGKLQQTEDNESDISSKTTQVDQLQKENRHLKSSLDVISSLKGDRAKYTALLNDITKILTDKSRLTAVSFKTGEGQSVICELSGEAFSQEEVAKVVEKVERLKNFKNVSLLFAGYQERQNGYDNDSNDKNNDGKNKMIRFNISAAYNAD